MKKFTSLLIASAVAVAATSVDASARSLHSPDQINTNVVKELPQYLAQETGAPVNRSFRGLRKADGLQSIEGFWVLYLYDAYFATSAGGYVPALYQTTLESDDPTVIHFIPLPDNEQQILELAEVMTGKYDEESNTVTFTKRFVSADGSTYTWMVPFHYEKGIPNIWDPSLDGIGIINEFSATYDVESGLLEFDQDCGLIWASFGNVSGSNDSFEGIYNMYETAQGIRFNPAIYAEGNWSEEIGMVTFKDGWLLPGQEGSTYDVPFQQNLDEPTMFRLVNPYKYGPAAANNGCPYDGYITFDIKDHKHVVFYPSDAGFLNYAILNGKGISQLFCYNALGYYVTSNPWMSLDEIIALQESNIPITTFSENTVWLNPKKYSNGNQAYDANIGYISYKEGTESQPYGGVFWQANMTAYIQFPNWFQAGVSTVVDDFEGQAEYFTLEGVRVSNPQPGQIIIKREGTKASKIVVR